jgi:competence protein ComEC
MRIRMACLVATMSLSIGSWSATAKTLDIYFIDVEGGQSTLIVSPEGETLLIDTGFASSAPNTAAPGIESSSHASRIVAAAKDAGAKQIDYLLITHFHGDHMGGAAELAELMPIKTFVDHGTLAQSEQSPRSMPAFEAYASVRAKGRHLQPKPGDKLRLKGVDATIVSSAAQVLKLPVEGNGKPNAACRTATRPAEDLGENARSTGLVLRWGKFRFLDIGDLTTRPLYDIVCPKDLIGPVDVYLVAHHGGADAAEPATLSSFKPRVSIVNNGAKKGGALKLLEFLKSDKLAGDVYQLHRAEAGGAANVVDTRVANLDESTAHWIKVSANKDGSFKVTNGRTGQNTVYEAR